MDSMAGEDPEEEQDWHVLPAKLQQLLLDLARNALSHLPNLSRDEFGGYFGHRSEPVPEGRHWRVRNRVLTAISNCHSLTSLVIDPEWQIGVDREDEVSLLLGGLQSNPSLKSMTLFECEDFGRQAAEGFGRLAAEGFGRQAAEGFGRQAACKALGQLIASSPSLLSLNLTRVGLSAEALGALAKGFNKDPVLEELSIIGNSVGDARGAQHLAYILANAPRLKFLQLEDIGMDVAGAEVIAKALPLCATLRTLVLDMTRPSVVEHSSPSAGGTSGFAIGPMSTVLKRAFTRAHDNHSISGVTHLSLLMSEAGEAGLADALAEMLRTNDCIQTLYTNPYALIHGLDGLRFNSSISNLEFYRYPEYNTEVWRHLVPLLKECKALRVLILRCLHGHASFKKELLRSLEGNASLNELNIAYWEDLDDDLFRVLMQCLQVNRTLRKIIITGTTWEREGKDAIIAAALARNATQEAYLPLLLDGQEPVMPTAGRLFLCGAPYAGKTTLRTSMIEAWQQETSATLHRDIDDAVLTHPRPGPPVAVAVAAVAEGARPHTGPDSPSPAVPEPSTQLAPIAQVAGLKEKLSHVWDSFRRCLCSGTDATSLREGRQKQVPVLHKDTGFRTKGMRTLQIQVLQDDTGTSTTREFQGRQIHGQVLDKLKDTGTRTEGIEIQVLRNDDDMQVTIWDLAGQAQYRALQDYLFPSNNQACIFLFAFNPFDDQHHDQLLRHEEVQKKFRKRLAFWLRFINSTSRNVGSTLPQVFVVVTHVDQMTESNAGILHDLLQPLLRDLASQFEQVLHVTTTPFFCRDARCAQTVKPLLDELLQSFGVLFRTKLFWVPEVCNRLTAVLTDWVSQHPAQPIVNKQQCRILFQKELQGFQGDCLQASLYAS